MGNTVSRFNETGLVVAAEAVTPANTTLNQFDCLWINDGGNVALKTPGCTTVTVWTSIDAGQFLSVNTDYVMTTSTTATNILGCTLGRTPGDG
jgi:hypothetical protein